MFEIRICSEKQRRFQFSGLSSDFFFIIGFSVQHFSPKENIARLTRISWTFRASGLTGRPRFYSWLGKMNLSQDSLSIDRKKRRSFRRNRDTIVRFGLHPVPVKNRCLPSSALAYLASFNRSPHWHRFLYIVFFRLHFLLIESSSFLRFCFSGCANCTKNLIIFAGPPGIPQSSRALGKIFRKAYSSIFFLTKLTSSARTCFRIGINWLVKFLFPSAWQRGWWLLKDTT